MAKRSKEMSALSRKRWGDSLVCRIKPLSNELQVARCKYNGIGVVGIGKDNLSAVTNVFTKINELRNKSK